MKEEKRFIVSIDGGGMRGIAPSTVLAKFSALLKEKGDFRPLYSHFDLAAGTSTGSLIALSLAIPLKTDNHDEGFETKIEKGRKLFGLLAKKELVSIEQGTDVNMFADLYKSAGKDIFSEKVLAKRLLPLFASLGISAFSPSVGLPAFLGSALTLLNEGRYDSAEFENFLSELFENKTLSSSLIPVMVVSSSKESGKAVIISSWNNPDLTAKDAARASSAAPTYFSPVTINGKELIDGGLAANNPSLFAYKEALKLYPKADKFYLLSLSTGGTNSGSLVDNLFGIKENMVKTDALISTFDNLEYIRIPISLESNIKLDETSGKWLNYLMYKAEEAFQNNYGALSYLADEMKREKTHSSVKVKKVVKK